MSELLPENEMAGSAINNMLAMFGEPPMVSMATLIELIDRYVTADFELDGFDDDFRMAVRERLLEIATRYNANTH